MNAERAGPMQPADAAEAGALLAASHADYPAFAALFRNRNRRRRILKTFMEATARDAARHGVALGVRRDSGLVGVALWMPPGAFPLSSVRKLRMTPALLRIGCRAPLAMPAFVRTGVGLERSLPAQPFWYLQVLGVHPRAQREGVGARLMARGLGRVDEARLSCYLHTSDPANIPYYERFGFTVEGSVGHSSPDRPRYTFMSRVREGGGGGS